ncbi:maleylpyruvate isomerase family mycothiol-dependent enzyme [Cellulomonas oligotrophica]|uniref:Uncharacterized protein (TIGR03083 family) n=1 Tax=Cellulomonas oligotrophica TaxID=931536 RepID=A0A7Y9FCK0_9CELL|nr:maleylpyruvate isomerase family mycothiol-dependent enzyme [Cellulomonas oligotrophica]NYD84760.1 uncharacterized protein (TIGR03083 family) [Cellulomonas oligotrophica]GIG31827.1 hypothetical protein Col01nite_09860 [Cellulomonas oligotrophica]
MPPWTSPDPLWEAVVAERARLLADLEHLTPDQWATPSMCGRWSVEDVVAHLTAAASTGRWAWVRSIVGARFDPDVHNDRRLAEHRGPTPDRTLDAFRQAVPSRVAAIGDVWAWLGEVVVHSADVREPLGITTVPAPAAVEAVAAGYARRDFAVRSRTVARGLALVADDGGFRTGDGPVVRGTTLDLVLAMAGRPAAVGRLTGDGVPELAARVTGAVAAGDPPRGA